MAYLITQAYKILVGWHVDGNSTYSELYLGLAAPGMIDSMDYYFIDSASRHPFWVHGVLTSDLGLPAYETKGFLSV